VYYPFYQLSEDECKKNTLKNYEYVLTKFKRYFNDIELSSITSDDIFDFMSHFTDGTKPNTKKLRFILLTAFFNFIKNSIDPDFKNPCDNPALRRLFKSGKTHQFKIIDKDIVDEMIFRTQDSRNRLILELMALGCMRIGEVLKLTPMDIEDRKLTIQDPKSGKESETFFLPNKVANRLKNTSARIR
jgi:site-specific recombinase XerD